MTLLLLMRSGAAGELPINRPVITMVPVVRVGSTMTVGAPVAGRALASLSPQLLVGIGTVTQAAAPVGVTRWRDATVTRTFDSGTFDGGQFDTFDRPADLAPPGIRVSGGV
jgi:hypothetical protein